MNGLLKHALSNIAVARYHSDNKVTVEDVAPTLTLTADRSVLPGDSYFVYVDGWVDPGLDTINGWTVSWGDGAVDYYPADTVSFEHVYSTGGVERTYTVTASDEEGTYPVEAVVWVGPEVSVMASDPMAHEDLAGGTGAFTFKRTGPTQEALTVTYTVGGGATPGDDYTALPGSVVIPAGASEVTVLVTPASASSEEVYNEQVVVTPDAPLGHMVGARSSANVTVVDAVVPPTKVRAYGISDSEIRVTWENNSDNETEFIIRYKVEDDPYAEYTVVSVPRDTTDWIIPGLPAGVTYTVLVQGVSSGNASPASDPDAGTTMWPAPGDEGAPAGPTALSATTVASDQIDLTWQDNSGDEDGFEIEALDSNFAWVQIASVGRDVNTYSHTGLTASTTYVYRVRAYKGSLKSRYSNHDQATTFPESGGGTLIGDATGGTTALEPYVSRWLTIKEIGLRNPFVNSGKIKVVATARYEGTNPNSYFRFGVRASGAGTYDAPDFGFPGDLSPQWRLTTENVEYTTVLDENYGTSEFLLDTQGFVSGQGPGAQVWSKIFNWEVKVYAVLD